MTRPSFESFLPIDRRLGSSLHSARAGTPWGGGLHYDASVGGDEGALSWFTSKANTNASYDVIMTDAGDVVAVHEDIEHRAAYHGGVAVKHPEWPVKRMVTDAKGRRLAKPYEYGSANDALIGLSVTTGGVGEKRPIAAQVTLPQGNAVVVVWALTVAFGRRFWRWPDDAHETRLLGHEEFACYSPKTHPDTPAMWGKLGRKPDPSGGRLALEAGRPILSTPGVRYAAGLFLADSRQRAAICEFATIDRAFVEDSLDSLLRGAFA